VFSVATPTLTPTGGRFAAPVQVAAACATPDVSIHYTLDGAEPTEADPLVSSGGRITVSQSATLTVKAWKAGHAAAAASATFEIVQVANIPARVTAGRAHSAALKADGTIWIWGDGSRGQLGQGLADGSLTPRRVEIVPIATSIAAGADHMLSLDESGNVWAWGRNDSGAIGDGSDQDRLLPVRVPRLTNVVALAAGSEHSLALAADGTLWAWGRGDSGQLGLGSTESAYRPVQVPGLSGVIAIAAGEQHSLALRSDGSVWAWGSSDFGQLGTGSMAPSYVPVAVPGLPSITAIAAGGYHSLAVATDGTAWGWGANWEGQVGNDSYDDALLPVQVMTGGYCGGEGGGCPPLSGVRALAAGSLHSLAATSDGAAWQWGDGNEVARTVYGLADIVQVTAGHYHSLALTADGTLWSWGDNAAGQIGDCSQNYRWSPVQISLSGLRFFSCEPPAAPEFSVPGGTYDDAISVAIVSPEPGTTLRYTTTGLDPTPADTAIPSGSSLLITQSLTLKARAWNRIGLPGPVTTAFYELRSPVPTFDPPGGDFTQPVTVMVWSPAAYVHYTTDGSTPTESSPGDVVVSLQVATTTTIKAIAVRTGCTSSLVATATYAMHFGVATAPAISPPGGQYSAPQTVALTGPPGATVRFTTDGSNPVPTSTAYTGPIAVDASTTLRAVAFHPDYEPSPVASATYLLKVPTPAPSPGTGSYAGTQSVSAGVPTPGAAVHFTTDGTIPTTSDPAATGGLIAVDGSLILTLRAFRDGWEPSDVARANYYIYADSVAPPTFSVPGGQYSAPFDVVLSTSTPGATIRYSVDGTEPTVGSPVYASLIHVASATILSARAFKGGSLPSATVTAVYSFDDGRVAAPTLSPPPGMFVRAQAVTVSCATPGAVLRYSLDGADPTEESTAIGPDGTVLVDRTVRLKVRAFLDGVSPSDIRTGDYQITGTVAAGSAHSVALKSDGSLWVWGAGDSGQLGLANLDPQPQPAQVTSLADVKAIAAGRAHTLALKADGTLWSFGANESGQLGNGLTEPSSTPLPVSGGWSSSIVGIAAGDAFSLALTATGEVWAWGANTDGQIGDGTNDPRPTPVLLSGLPTVVAIAAGATHALALTNTGEVWAWGRNLEGELGDGTTQMRLVPQLVPFPGSPAPSIADISAGARHSLAVDATGALWVWGSNDSRQLGLGPPASRTSPERLTSVTSLAGVAGGDLHSLALSKAGEVLAFGRNIEGQLGDGTSQSRATAAPVLGLFGALRIAAGARHSLAVTDDGSVWAWGAGEEGQIGDGVALGTRVPVRLTGFKLAANDAMSEDPDLDGLSTAEEQRLGTDPYDPDTNGDGIPDGVAVSMGISATSPDTDGDGLRNIDERARGTNPLKWDTDGDGFSDSVDLFPLDPTRWASPPKDERDTTPPTITLREPANAVRLP
jgi:alpha-tubulin suppressor-like RCC1 family protein